MMEALFGCFKDTLTSEHYARYLEVRRERERTGQTYTLNVFEGVRVGSVGVKYTPMQFEDTRVQRNRKLDAAIVRIDRRIAQKKREEKERKTMITKMQGTRKMVREMVETNPDVYTMDDMFKLFGLKMTTVRAFVRHGTIPKDAVVTQGVYNKTVIDQMVKDGVFAMTANQRYNKKKAAEKAVANAQTPCAFVKEMLESKTPVLSEKTESVKPLTKAVSAKDNSKNKSVVPIAFGVDSFGKDIVLNPSLSGLAVLPKYEPTKNRLDVKEPSSKSDTADFRVHAPSNKNPANVKRYDFWAAHTELAARIMALPEQSRTLVIECADEILNCFDTLSSQ